MTMSTFSSVQADLVAFAAARGWTEVHTPQNLALALASEVGELCHILRWGEEGVDPTAIAEEIADIGIFLAYLCAHYGLDLPMMMAQKMQANSSRFSAE